MSEKDQLLTNCRDLGDVKDLLALSIPSSLIDCPGHLYRLDNLNVSDYSPSECKKKS